MALSLREKIDMLEIFVLKGKSPRAAQSAYCSAQGLRTGPSLTSFRNIYSNFKEFGSVSKPKSKRTPTVQNEQKIQRVRDLNETAATSGQSLSVRIGARDLEISKSVYHRIIRRDLKMYPNIPRLKHHLTEDDPDHRLEFC